MAIVASQLIAQISVMGAEAAQAKLQAMGAETDAAQAKFKGLAVLGAGLVAAGLVAAGVAAVKMAADFQSSTTTLVTGAGEMQSNLDMVRQGILQMAVDTGTSTDQLVKGMFNVESAGFRGAAGLQLMRIAAEGAKVGVADLGQVTDILTTTLHDYNMNVNQSVPVMNSLIQTVKDGKMHMDDLNQSLTAVLPVAGTFHIKLSDVEAALATMAAAGDRGAAAGTHLEMMFKMLENPTGKAAKEMQAMGINSVTLAQTMSKSLPDAFQMIQDAVAKHFVPGSVQYNRAIADILGGSKSGAAGLELLGDRFGLLKQNVQDISGVMQHAGKDVMGWATVQQDFNFKLDRAKEVVATFAIRIGTALLPALGHLLDLLPNLVNYLSDFGHHANVLVPILVGLGTVLAVLLVPAIWAFAAGVIAATWPALAIGAAVAGLVAIFMHFYQTNAGFKAFIDNMVTGLRNFWTMLQANIMPAMQRLGSFIQTSVVPVLKQVGDFLKGTFQPAWDSLAQAWNKNILPGLKMLGALLQPLLPVLKALGVVILVAVLVPLALLAASFVLALKELALFLQFVGWAVGAIGEGFHRMGQTITDFKNLVGNIFNAIGTFIHDKIMWIYNHNSYVHLFVDLIVGYFNNLKAKVTEVFAYVAIWIQQKFAEAEVFAERFKSALGDQFNQLGTNIHTAVTAAWNWLVGFVSGWPSQAFQWGVNLIQGLVNGIGSMIGNVKQAVGNVMSSVAGLIGFHSPTKEGPGREADKWAPNLMNMFTAGILAGAPGVRNALSGILSPIGTSLSVNATGSYTPFASGAALASSVSSSGSSQPIILQVDGQTFARLILPHVVSNIRNTVGTVNI